MSSAAAPIPEERADAAAWLAVMAGALGALMATLDISIVNSALPTIQGEIGASGTEGTWISTAYLVAEIVIIPLSGWLERVLGLRTLLFTAASLFTGFSMICGLSTSLPMMVIGRIGQGFTGGALIPTAMTIVATRLPPYQQPVGNTVFGATMILGPLAGPMLGGWLTENISWHYAFFLNLPIGIALTSLVLVTMPHQRAHLDQLRHADWFGIIGMAMGLGGLTVVLEEGERELWFSSPEIRWMALTAVVGFLFVAIGQMRASRPVIRLALLRDPQFGAIVAIVTMLGMVFYGTSYIIPQFLTAVAGYNALQSGEVVMLSGIPIIVMMPFTPRLMRTVDIRIAVSFGLLLLMISAWLETDITAQTAGGTFALSQLIRGLGTVFASFFLNQAAVRSVSPAYAADAAGLYNGARNLGGSLVLAGLAVIQDQRTYLHGRRIEESLSVNSVGVQTYVANQSTVLGSQDAALQSLDHTIQLQALVMTYADLFWLLSIGILFVIPAVLLLRPLPQHFKPMATH